jgi:NAD(P)-dependent dehydrogenase (short-subunit alcohol dehydrogenase family)
VLDEVMAVNARGPIKMCEAFLPHVGASAQKKLITVSSSQGSIGSVKLPMLYFYRASKAAVNMLMANLALQVKGRGIIVGLVTPGATDTDFMKGLPKKMLRPVEDAVSGMLRDIDAFTLARTGQFLDTSGEPLPW